MAAVPGSNPASDAGGALGQLGGPVLAAAPWAPIAATPELRRPPSGPLQVRAPQLAPCCVAHKLSNANANAPSPPRGVTGCAPLRACSQAIAAPGSRTVGCTGAPSQQPLLVCAPHFATCPNPSSMTCQPRSHRQYPLPVRSRRRMPLPSRRCSGPRTPSSSPSPRSRCACVFCEATSSACSTVDAIHRPPCSCPNPPCAQAPDADPTNEAAVRAVLLAHFERGEPGDYVQLKDVAVALEAHHPSCHRRLCFKAGTRLPNNEALAAVVSRGTGLQVRNAQVTLSGHVKVRGLIKDYRKVRAVLAASHASLAMWPRRAGRRRVVGARVGARTAAPPPSARRTRRAPSAAAANAMLAAHLSM